MRAHLWRSLFPSWRFFDRPGAPFVLEVSWEPDHWERLHLPPARDWRWPLRLLVNPAGNLALAWQSLVDRLAQELEASHSSSPGEVGDWVAYQMIRDGVEAQARGRTYRIRLTHEGDVLLLSPLYEVR